MITNLIVYVVIKTHSGVMYVFQNQQTFQIGLSLQPMVLGNRTTKYMHNLIRLMLTLSMNY
jgi:hypothetical protein